MKKYTFELFADYYQFYLQDENAEGDLSNSWATEAVERLLALALVQSASAQCGTWMSRLQ